MSELFKLSEDERFELQELLEELELRRSRRRIDRFFPDEGTDGTLYGKQTEGEWIGDWIEPTLETWSRSMYPKHLTFFEAGAKYNQRLFCAGNRVGKTYAAGYELVCHMTGIYPHWWKGRRFHANIEAWVIGVNASLVKEVLQTPLFGQIGEFGTGLIPYEFIEFDSLKDAKKADTGITAARIKHVSGAYSTMHFKSFESGRAAFQGAAKHVIWCDEEPPQPVYEETLLRTMTTNGLMILTFTPLLGMSQTIKTFMTDAHDNMLPFATGALSASKHVTMCGWDDVPHITSKMKSEMLAGMPSYQRDSRSQGIPALGSGVVYPVDATKIFIDPFEIPKHWKRVAGLDFGWTAPTAIVWGAINPEDNICYIYSEHYVSEQPMAVHASSMKQRDTAAGYVIPIVCDPSGGGTSQADGRHTFDLYKTEYNVVMKKAINSIHPGIAAVLHLFNAGRLKIFSTCVKTREEMRFYAYEKGTPEGADHAMDALRYLVMSGIDVAKGPPKLLDQNYGGVSHQFRGQF